MAMDFDAQLIESVEVRRNRLTSSLVDGFKARRLPPGRGQLLLTGKSVRTAQAHHDGAAQ